MHGENCKGCAMQSAEQKNHAELESRIPRNWSVRFGGGHRNLTWKPEKALGSYPTLRPFGPMRDGSRLSVVLDLFSRRVIGWAMAATQDETLIETARLLALLGRHPAAGLLFHSDRGSQY